MERPTLQMTVATMLGLVACIAVNFWLFRLGVFWGILGLNVTKHVAIAYLCQILGVDRRRPVPAPARHAGPPSARPGRLTHACVASEFEWAQTPDQSKMAPRFETR